MANGLNLAKSTFNTRADEKLATADAYDLTSAQKVITSLPDINDQINLGDFTGLKGGNLGEGLNLFSGGAGLGFKASPDALFKGLVSSNSGLSSALSGLSGPLKTALLKGGGNSKISATFDGITKMIGKADLSTLTGLGGLIKGVSNSSLPFSFTDMSGLTNFSTNIIKQASGFGIPNAFKAFSTGLGNNTIMASVTKNLLPTVVGTSNVNLLLNIAQSQFGGNVKRLQPGFINDFARAFKLPTGTPQRNTPAIVNDILTSFGLIDANWNKKPRTVGTPSINMNTTRNASPDFVRLMNGSAQRTPIPINTSSPSTINTSNTLSDFVKQAAMQKIFKDSIGPGEEVISGGPTKRPLDADAMSCLRSDFPLVAWD